MFHINVDSTGTFEQTSAASALYRYKIMQQHVFSAVGSEQQQLHHLCAPSVFSQQSSCPTA